MEYRNITIAYGERTILRDINILIEPGEFVFLIGTSGSGKTSFIKSLLGAKKLKSGNIIDDNGTDIAEFSPKELLEYRRSLGIIFQDFKLLPKKTVRENVAFAMEVCGYSAYEITRRVPEVLAKVGLLAKKEVFVETLSGGEIQRTCIARALIHDPQIIIGDEPTGNLDRTNATEIMHLLNELNQSGKTIIMATHDETIVNSMKKRVIAFEDGKIVSDKEGGNYCL
ncbi:ATP-binding cassette domain-containing protein [Candidatus Gracilibacteria bacterium]|nr:ATP-binding cassette domain-containing protein [Candidatus Gracilibacteria bacterium]